MCQNLLQLNKEKTEVIAFGNKDEVLKVNAYLDSHTTHTHTHTHPGELHRFGQQAHDHDVEAHVTHRLQPLGDELRLELLHQAAHLVVHHVGSGVEPLEHHADQPRQTLGWRVLARRAQTHLIE